MDQNSAQSVVEQEVAMNDKKLDIIIVPLYNTNMDIIIDSSCIVAVLLGESEVETVKKAAEGKRLVSAACLPYEVGNSLSAAVKRHRICPEDAVLAYKEFLRIPIRLIEPDISKAVRIAAEEKHYAYDAYYIACAIDTGNPLYSLDQDMIEIAEKRGVKCL